MKTVINRARLTTLISSSLRSRGKMRFLEKIMKLVAGWEWRNQLIVVFRSTLRSSLLIIIKRGYIYELLYDKMIKKYSIVDLIDLPE